MELIKTNGGKILYENIDGKEKIAHFADPAGNMMGLYQHGK